MQQREQISEAPRGLAILAVVGPSFIWCAEYIGSGEVILATRTGALLGTAVLWAVVLAIVLKCAIGMAGAHWTALTGEGMIDMFDRTPGPRHWLVWLVLAVQLPAGVVSIGALAKATGVFLNAWMPLPGGPITWGIAASLFAMSIAWTGRFNVLKMVMSALVAVIVLGVAYVALRVMPPGADILRGLFGLEAREIPAWATAQLGRPVSPWQELLPLMGWSAGGFASQVWYGYWVLGAGYGMAAGRDWGQRADEAALTDISPEQVGRLRSWCRIVHVDAAFAAVIGITATMGFTLAGAGVLRPAHLVPSGNAVALTLSHIFSAHWGNVGSMLFLIAGSAALISTLVGTLSGWPRMLSDCIRVIHPAFGRMPAVTRLRAFLVFFVLTNAVAVTLFEPVKLVQLAGQLDGILLTPVQAAAILFAFLYLLPRLFGRQQARQLRPGLLLLTLLAVATVVFGLLCVFYLPRNVWAIIAG